MDISAASLFGHLAKGSGRLWEMTQQSRVTTFIGAGGKTTCLRSLSHEIEAASQYVIATTTTKVYPEGQMIPWRKLHPPDGKGTYFWYNKVEDDTGKWIGPSITDVDKAISEDLGKWYWVIEGDGARGCRLKCWETYEPQIPNHTDCAVLVLDRGLWGNVLQASQVHRYHLCRDLIGQVLSSESAWNYFLRSPVFAPRYAHLFWVILLNSADSMDSSDILNGLRHKWEEEIQDSSDCVEKRPKHLRIAAGDALKGDLRWFDLW